MDFLIIINSLERGLCVTRVRQFFQYNGRFDISSSREYINTESVLNQNLLSIKGDECTNVLVDVITEILIFMQGEVISSNIDNALKENQECLAFNETFIDKNKTSNWYIMKRFPWEKSSIEVLITRENFVEMFNAWQKYMVELPNYIIITREDNHYSITSADNLDAFETTKK
jgi:hypothetical protein